MSYVKALEKELGNSTKIIGIVEFGSYAKDEATPVSDIDTRVYVSNPKHYIWQPVIARFDQSQQDTLENRFTEFEKEFGASPKLKYDWATFNKPLAEKISAQVNINIEFGLADYRYTMFELQNLNIFATVEHAILLQSNILYDPKKWLKKTRDNIRGKKFPPLVSFYKKRYLDALPFEIYQFLKNDTYDDFKIKKSGQIQWVKWAVRCLRDAVASKTYINSGNFTYQKSEVLNFYKHHIPEDYKFIQEIYDWKTNAITRQEIVNDFLNNRKHYFELFESLMPRLESVVKKVNKTQITK